VNIKKHVTFNDSKDISSRGNVKNSGINKKINMVLLSYIDLLLGGFSETLSSGMIFPRGKAPREISSLRVIFRRIPLAPGL
jgi:hypothetical protein